MKKPKQKPKCKRIISRLKTEPQDWFMYVCPKCEDWYDEVDHFAPYHNEYSKCYKCDKETMSEDKIQKAWEDYHGPINPEDGEDYIPMMPPAFMRGYVDGYEQGKKDAFNARDANKDSGA